MMGKYAAELPGDRRYASNHMWCQQVGERHFRFGFTAYAIRLMRDVYFLDWSVNVGDTLQQRQEIGHIETSKAQSDLFAPIAGTLTLFNVELLKDPSAINTDNYGAGWLFEMEGSDDKTFDLEGYYKFLDENWESTQRILKGKVHD